MNDCEKCIMAVKDALEVLNGRWKLPILVSLKFSNKRFKEISKDLNGITDKMLSKELKELEMDQLITRTVQGTFPPTVEYAITEHGHSLDPVIFSLKNWGAHHRKKIIGKTLVFLLCFGVYSGYAQFKYPATKQVDSADTYFGRTYKDPYRWLERLKDPAAITWFKDEADYTNSILSKLNGRDELIAEWKMLDKLINRTPVVTFPYDFYKVKHISFLL